MKLFHILPIALVAALSVLPASAQSVRVLGRAAIAGDGTFSVQWPGSGFEATFTGPRLTVTVEDWGDSAYHVEIDGEEAVLELEPGRNQYNIYSGAPGEHTVRVTRKTSANSGPSRFSYIRASGRTHPTRARDRRMLVIGDDNVTGYGVLGEDRTCSFSYATQDHARTFAALAASSFDADLHAIGFDGRGLDRNHGDNPDLTMRELNQVVLPGAPLFWDVSKYQPQVVVVNLGASDFWNGETGDEFDKSYADFLGELRGDYPEALIIAAMGPQLHGEVREAAHNSVKWAVAARQQAGDDKVEFLEFELARQGRVWGCDWHPGIDTQAGMAWDLEDLIHERLGWDVGGWAEDMLAGK